MAYVISPEGETGIIADSDVENAVKNFGFKLREPSARELEQERVSGPAHALVAGAEGVINALPYGEKFTEALYSLDGRTPEEVKQTIKLREEQHPIAKAAGTALETWLLTRGATGIAAGAAGGTGVAASAARAAARVGGPKAVRALGAASRFGVAGAEGAWTGLSHEVNESILEDRPLVAEQVAASMFQGFKAGAAAAAGGELVARGVGAIAPRVTKLAAKATEKLDKLPDLGYVGMGAVALGGPKVAGLIAVGKGVSKGIRILGSESAQARAATISSMVERRLASGADFLGPFRPAIEQAYSQGPEHLLQTHEALMKSPRAEEYQNVMGIEPDTHESAQAAMQRAEILNGIKLAAKQQESQTSEAVDGLFSSRGYRTSKYVPTSAKDFKSQIANVDAILRDPEAVYTQFHPEVAAAAPEVIGTATATLLRGAQYLKDHAPQSPYANMPAAVAPHWEPSAADLDRFSRIRTAVESPAEVLKKMAQGYISTDQVDALRAVYPAMYEDLRLKITERLMQASKPLTYQQRLGVMAIVGPQALGMSAQQAQILQSSFAPSQPGQNSATKGPDGRQKVNQEKNLQTQSQRLEGR